MLVLETIPVPAHPGDHSAQLSCVSFRVGKEVKREADHSSGNLSQPPKGCTELGLEHTEALRNSEKHQGRFGWSRCRLTVSVWSCRPTPNGRAPHATMSGPELHLHKLAHQRGSIYPVQALGAIIQGASFYCHHDLHPVSLLWTVDET